MILLAPSAPWLLVYSLWQRRRFVARPKTRAEPSTSGGHPAAIWGSSLDSDGGKPPLCVEDETFSGAGFHFENLPHISLVALVKEESIPVSWAERVSTLEIDKKWERNRLSSDSSQVVAVWGRGGRRRSGRPRRGPTTPPASFHPGRQDSQDRRFEHFKRQPTYATH